MIKWELTIRSSHDAANVKDSLQARGFAQDFSFESDTGEIWADFTSFDDDFAAINTILQAGIVDKSILDWEREVRHYL